VSRQRRKHPEHVWKAKQRLISNKRISKMGYRQTSRKRKLLKLNGQLFKHEIEKNGGISMYC